MSNKMYDVLKWIALYLLPAVATLYFAVSTIWQLPYGKEVVGTITAIDAFLGMILGISTAQYNKVDRTDGTFQVDTTSTSTDIYRLQLNKELDELSAKNLLTFKVDTNANLSQK